MNHKLTDADAEVIERVLVDVVQKLPQPQGVVGHCGHVPKPAHVTRVLGETWNKREHEKSPLTYIETKTASSTTLVIIVNEVEKIIVITILYIN